MPFPPVQSASAVRTAGEIARTEPFTLSRPLATTADVPLHNAIAAAMGFEIHVMHAPLLDLEPNQHLDGSLAPVHLAA